MIRAQHGHFRRLRLLHFHDELCRIEQRFRAVHQPGPHRFILRVVVTRALARPALHDHFVPAFHQLRDSSGNHAHPVLLRLDLLRYTNFHALPSTPDGPPGKGVFPNLRGIKAIPQRIRHARKWTRASAGAGLFQTRNVSTRIECCSGHQPDSNPRMERKSGTALPGEIEACRTTPHSHKRLPSRAATDSARFTANTKRIPLRQGFEEPVKARHTSLRACSTMGAAEVSAIATTSQHPLLLVIVLDVETHFQRPLLVGFYPS